MDINGIELLKLIEVTSFGGSFGLRMEDSLNDLIVLYSNYQPDNQYYLEDSKEITPDL